MNIILEQAKRKINSGLDEFWERGDFSIDRAERDLFSLCLETVREMLGSIYEELDREIREDKESRRGRLTVVRKNDPRSILTVFGEVRYSRTYYKMASGGYEYPVDRYVGIDSHERLSYGTSVALVDCATYESYSRTSDHVLNGNVSKQTVMNKLRTAQSREKPDCDIKKRVPVIHIDADEDHVALQKGRNVQVPLVTVYEGVDRTTKRHKCINAFSISRYGMDTDSFWELVSDEIEKRYDLSKTKVYLHGDGASWIQKGLEYLPRGSVFVLDRYHANKYITESVAGLDEKDQGRYRRRIRDSFREDTSDELSQIMLEMVSRYPDRAEKIVEGMGYLINFFDAIHIKIVDEEARCGSSEPHVQHVLSCRLSTNPMGWSEETLKHIVPLLADKDFFLNKEPPISESKNEVNGFSCAEVLRMERKLERKVIRHSLGMTDPDKCVYLPATYYKKTALSELLKDISRI